ncbi:hypothetical protein CICLE_v10017319mg [Citrus x clementina]|uniref:Uncharacterized protein n=1 Tax=Citrus clementina TaxID=85681 RepID=V4U117_CITCL|nr:hypothetical protein CICLE_v10017319mg [Citrus x clementina]
MGNIEAEQVGRQARSHKEVKKPRRHIETEDKLKQRVLAAANTKNSSLFVCNNRGQLAILEILKNEKGHNYTYIHTYIHIPHVLMCCLCF